MSNRAGKSTDPIMSKCLIGFKLKRLASLALLSPNKNALKPCMISCPMIAIKRARIFIKVEIKLSKEKSKNCTKNLNALLFLF